MTKLFYLVFVLIGVIHAAKHRTLFHQRPLYIRASYASACKDNSPDTALENVVINYRGKNFYVNATYLLYRTIKSVDKMIVHIRRCNDQAEEVNCEHFQSWRFGKESCDILQQKNTVWAPLISAMHPPLRCPTEKGTYKITNATLDMDILVNLFRGLPVERYFWRIRVEMFDYRMFTCFAFGLYATVGKN